MISTPAQLLETIWQDDGKNFALAFENIECEWLRNSKLWLHISSQKHVSNSYNYCVIDQLILIAKTFLFIKRNSSLCFSGTSYIDRHQRWSNRSRVYRWGVWLPQLPLPILRCWTLQTRKCSQRTESHRAKALCALCVLGRYEVVIVCSFKFMCVCQCLLPGMKWLICTTFTLNVHIFAFCMTFFSLKLKASSLD